MSIFQGINDRFTAQVCKVWLWYLSVWKEDKKENILCPKMLRHSLNILQQDIMY